MSCIISDHYPQEIDNSLIVDYSISRRFPSESQRRGLVRGSKTVRLAQILSRANKMAKELDIPFAEVAAMLHQAHEDQGMRVVQTRACPIVTKRFRAGQVVAILPPNQDFADKTQV